MRPTTESLVRTSKKCYKVHSLPTTSLDAVYQKKGRGSFAWQLLAHEVASFVNLRMSARAWPAPCCCHSVATNRVTTQQLTYFRQTLDEITAGKGGAHTGSRTLPRLWPPVVERQKNLKRELVGNQSTFFRHCVWPKQDKRGCRAWNKRSVFASAPDLTRIQQKKHLQQTTSGTAGNKSSDSLTVVQLLIRLRKFGWVGACDGAGGNLRTGCCHSQVQENKENSNETKNCYSNRDYYTAITLPQRRRCFELEPLQHKNCYQNTARWLGDKSNHKSATVQIWHANVFRIRSNQFLSANAYDQRSTFRCFFVLDVQFTLEWVAFLQYQELSNTIQDYVVLVSKFTLFVVPTKGRRSALLNVANQWQVIRYTCQGSMFFLFDRMLYLIDTSTIMNGRRTFDLGLTEDAMSWEK